MTPRERLTTVLKGGIPDCVPVAPDLSNMIPARLTGRPFWDLYLYHDPPIWEAYIAAARRFGIDSLMDGYFPLTFDGEQDGLPWTRLPATPEQAKRIVPADQWERFIVFRGPERIVTQRSRMESGRRLWEPRVCVYHVADSPTEWIPPAKIRLPDVPRWFEPLEEVRPADTGPSGLGRVKEILGDQGLVGVFLASSCVLSGEQDVYDYFDHPELHGYWADRLVEQVERRFARIMAMEVLPDFFCVGGSGTLIWQSVETFRQLAFPAVQRAIELAGAAGIPTHIHSCGPERALVEVMAEETSLTVIDPLEIPPMGDCRLSELKRLYGHRLVLKGNLHTTDVMLFGSPGDVMAASRQAIDDAAEGGRFILSTGDQCGRDTPDENLHAMIETARTYGRY
jgi:uroporphyrinogen decarboxylase